MTFQPAHPRSGERAEQADAVNPYMTTNPTLVLPSLGLSAGRPEDADAWATNVALPHISPDVLEPGQHYQIATEDLWAVSAIFTSPPGRGAWQATPSDSGQSDFLVIEPLASTASPVPATPSAPIATPTPVPAVTPFTPNGTSWPNRNAVAYDDPIRPLSILITAAIERTFHDQNEILPTERNQENVDLVRRLVINYLRRDRATVEAVSDIHEAERLIAMVIDDVLGFGPLEQLLRDETVTEIMVTGPHMTYVEQGGRLHEVPIQFEDDKHLLRVIQKILRPLGQSVSTSMPIADGRLPDGTRVNVVIPPSAISGPTLTLRRPVRRTYSLEQLVRIDTLSLHMADFLRLCVNARLNIAISGNTGTGKTTILNAIASSIQETERIVTIEETLELQLHQRHIVPFEARPTGDILQGTTIGDLLLNALRMRPQRIILGDCRGAEALTFIQALNMGFDGSLTTLYANSARDALTRLEALSATAGIVMSAKAIRHQLATGLDLIVHCVRLRDGTRRITHVTDVVGIDGDVIVTQDLFIFREAGLDMSTGRIRGEFVATGAKPSFVSRIEDSQSQMFPPHYFPRGA